MELQSDHSEQDTSRCFVPEILVDFLTKQIRLGREAIEPTTYFLQGVCLLVDISGFTKLSGDFCALGKSGIDGLQLATNGYMEKLVETIYLFGGDIIKFAGDAIICIFPSTLITKVVKSTKGRLFRRSTETGSIDLCDGFGNLDNGGRPLLLRAKSCHPNLRGKSVSVKTFGSPTSQGYISIKPDHILRAMHCANELKSLRTDTLTVHVAISCGEMCFGVLGGFEDRWECLISGPCLEELSGCLDDGSSMQAVMTGGCLAILNEGQTDTLHSTDTDLTRIKKENSSFFPEITLPNVITARLLEGRQSFVDGYTFTFEALPSGNHKILTFDKSVYSPKCEVALIPAAVKDRSDDALHALILKFVPVLINEANRHGTGLNYLSEIREVTTMFMKWDSYDSTKNYTDLLVLQNGFYQVQRILHSTGAYLRQFLVDDKGCVLIACWGMPSQTYLDNAHRALTAAVEIRTALLELQMKCSFGITTGDVYCGTVGSVLRMEYAAIGSVVNMAARLMGKAHGGILIDEPTYRRVPVLMQTVLVKLSPIQVKGRAEPMQVFEHDHNVAETSMSVSGVGATIIHSADGQDDLLEVRDCCRMPFANLLRMLDGHGPVRRRSMIRDLFTSLTSNSSLQTASLRMQVFLVEGKKGSGCKSSSAWLIKQAQALSIRVVHVMLVDKSFQYPYYLLYKLFTLIAPRDVYTSKKSQRRYVHALLKEVYPTDGNTATNTAFPIMKQALAMTCTYTRDTSPSDEVSVSIAAGAAGIRSARSIRHIKQQPFPPKLVTEVLCAIFTHLLTERTVLVIIDDIHLADEESLRVLVELLKITDPKSAIVMTSHSNSDTLKRKLAVQSGLRTPRRPIVKFTTDKNWHMKYQALVKAEPNVSVISVGDFTVSEINSMLQTIPGSADFPPNLPALVANLAGGEFFWVKEIMHFLHENGSKQFLSTIGSEAETAGAGAGASGGEGLSGTQSVAVSRTNSGNFPLSSTSNTEGAGPGPAGGGGRESYSAMEHLKLEQLVVCRFENLNLATKQVLRTASIIGAAFSKKVLYDVLFKYLKTDITNCLLTLKQQQWILRSETEPDTYEFRHVYTHQIIYNITPESERRNLHKVIADFIEEISAGDASQAAQLSYHYGMCDTDKALFYTYQATMFLLENGSFFELSECAELLYQAVEYCHTPHSVEVLIKLVKEVLKSTAAIPPSRHPLLSLLARYLCSCLCGRSAAVHVIESSSNRSTSSLAQQQQQVSGGEVAAGANAQMHIGHSHITAFEGDHTKAQDLFLDQLQNLLALLAVRNHCMSSEQRSHKAKEWEKAVLQNSDEIRDKPHAKVKSPR